MPIQSFIWKLSLTFTRHADVVTLVKPTGLAAVAAEGRYLTLPVDGATMVHSLGDTAPEEPLKHTDRQSKHETEVSAPCVSAPRNSPI